ncbi:hypothetical protein [Nocardioides sp.]|uniref:hypothetical protein n=1 Tax=Nocardioides sp. TaxID=35761 RepID=UPI003783D2F2
MTVTLAPSAPSPPEPPPTGSRRWGVGRVVAAVAATVLLAAGVGSALTAGVVRLADATMRDDAGFVSGSTTRWSSPGYAVRTEDVVLDRGLLGLDVPRGMIGTVRVTVDPQDSTGLFVGIARAGDVDAFLQGVAQSTVTEPFGDGGSATPSYAVGGALPTRPDRAGIWVASAGGTGARTITWDPEPGSWALVVTTADGTRPVVADVTLGAELPVLHRLASALLVAGLVVAGLAGVALWFVLRTREEAPRAARA